MTKTVTPLPREGNAPPRIAETAHGMLNSIGLANPGLERFLADHLPRLRELGIPLWVTVGGFCAADYAETCARLAGIEAIELNLSCPNVDEAADSAAEIVAACRAATTLPLYAKLSPRTRTSPRSRARSPPPARTASRSSTRSAASRSTSDAPPDARPRQRRLLRPGAEAGRARTPCRVCHEATGLPIVGMGGIETGRDALEFSACGARDVALGTVLFADPGAPARVRAELVAACADAGVATPDDARELGKKPGNRAKSPA